MGPREQMPPATAGMNRDTGAQREGRGELAVSFLRGHRFKPPDWCRGHLSLSFQPKCRAHATASAWASPAKSHFIAHLRNYHSSSRECFAKEEGLSAGRRPGPPPLRGGEALVRLGEGSPALGARAGSRGRLRSSVLSGRNPRFLFPASSSKSACTAVDVGPVRVREALPEAPPRTTRRSDWAGPRLRAVWCPRPALSWG